MIIPFIFFVCVIIIRLFFPLYQFKSSAVSLRLILPLFTTIRADTSKATLAQGLACVFPLSLCFSDNGVSFADTLHNLGVSVKIFLDFPPLAEADNFASALGCAVGVLKLICHDCILSSSCVPDNIYNKRLALYVNRFYKLFHKRHERHGCRTDVHCMLFTTDTIDERGCSI